MTEISEETKSMSRGNSAAGLTEGEGGTIAFSGEVEAGSP
jgi:hypothetical protein